MRGGHVKAQPVVHRRFRCGHINIIDAPVTCQYTPSRLPGLYRLIAAAAAAVNHTYCCCCCSNNTTGQRD